MKKLLLLFALMLSFNSLFAQRHLKGIKSIDLTGGLTGLGWYADLGGIMYLNNKSYIKADLFRESAKINKTIPFISYGLNAGYYRTIFKPTESIFINVGGGGSVVFDNITDKTIELADNKSNRSVNYGMYVGAETEMFLGNRFVWIVNFRQNWYAREQLGHWVWYFGTGVRFNIL